MGSVPGHMCRDPHAAWGTAQHSCPSHVTHAHLPRAHVPITGPMKRAWMDSQRLRPAAFQAATTMPSRCSRGSHSLSQTASAASARAISCAAISDDVLASSSISFSMSGSIDMDASVTLSSDCGDSFDDAEASAAADQRPRPLLDLSLDQQKAVGCLLGAMCGNALGAPIEGDRHFQVVRQFPDGVTNFWPNDLHARPISPGHTTGDFLMLLASAHSMADAGACDATHMAAAVAGACDPGKAPGVHGARRYGLYSRLLIEALRADTSPLAALPYLADQFIQASGARGGQTSSDRAAREPWGPGDLGGAARIAPVALAYRDAPAEVLDQAVSEACLFSHTHELGLSGARIMAAAIAWMTKQPPPSPQGPVAPAASPQQGVSTAQQPEATVAREGAAEAAAGAPTAAAAASPEALLDHLIGLAPEGSDMRAKLTLLRGHLFQVGEVTSWRRLFKSEQWHRLVHALTLVTYHGYATAGTEAAAVALWAVVTSWGRPAQALSMAAAFGGSTPMTTQLTGALVGALYGTAWLPATWWGQLENDPVLLADYHAHVDRVAALMRGSGATAEAAEEEAAPAGTGPSSGRQQPSPAGAASPAGSGAAAGAEAQESAHAAAQESRPAGLGMRDEVIALGVRLAGLHSSRVGMPLEYWQRRRSAEAVERAELRRLQQLEKVKRAVEAYRVLDAAAKGR